MAELEPPNEDLTRRLFVENPEETALGWFYRVLRNAVVDHRRRSFADRGLAAFAREIDEALEPDIETRGVLRRGIGELATTLKPEYRTAIEQVEVQGKPLGEFAAEAEISSNNARLRHVDCTCRHPPVPSERV